MASEFRMAALGGGQAVGSREALLVGELLPGHLIFRTCSRHSEVPRQITDGFAHLCQGITTQGLEELVLRVPQLGEDQVAQGVGLLLVELCLGTFPRQGVHEREGAGIAIHIAVDGGAGVLLLPAATDALLHAVLHIALPVETVRQTVGTFPAGIFLFKSGLQTQHEGGVALYLPHLLHGVGVPAGEAVHTLHRLSVVTVVPRTENLVHVSRIAQPAALHHVVTNGASYEVVLVGIGARHKELGHAITHGGALDVLAQRPPAIVVELTEVIVRAVEQGNVPSHPFRRLCVGDGGDDVFVLHRVEALGIVSEVIVVQHGGGCNG